MSLKGAGPLKLLWWILSLHRATAVGMLLLAIGVAACEIAIPWFIQEAVDAAFSQAGSRDIGAVINTIGFSMLGIIAALYVLHMLLLRAEAHVLFRGTFRLRQKLYSTVLFQPLAFFSRRKVGELQHRIINDVDMFESNSVFLFSDLPFELLTMLGVLTMMVITNLNLAAVAVSFLAIAAFASTHVGRSLPDLQKKIQSMRATQNARLQEGMSGIRAVKTFGRESHEVARLDQAGHDIVHLETTGGRVESYLLPLFDLMELLGVVLVIWYGAHLMVAKEITPGNLVAFLAYMEILAGPVSKMDKYYRYMQKFRAVSERIGSFFGELETPHVDITPSPTSIPTAPIIFNNVFFSYGDNARSTLQQVSFRADAGDIIALVGKNGAGKSTLIDLLLKFYVPTSGAITVGGVNLSQVNAEAWRQRVGFMSQEVFLIHGTVKENIAYGKPAATLEDIQAAAHAAHLDQLLRRLPNGLDTVVGDRGTGLSGGERQRIALARLFLRNPQILIFDEPTAHLDTEAARDVTHIISRLAPSRTMFIVSHRPDTLAIATRALLLDEGRIIADGPPEELMRTQSLFRVLTREGHPRERPTDSERYDAVRGSGS